MLPTLALSLPHADPWTPVSPGLEPRRRCCRCPLRGIRSLVRGRVSAPQRSSLGLILPTSPFSSPDCDGRRKGQCGPPVTTSSLAPQLTCVGARRPRAGAGSGHPASEGCGASQSGLCRPSPSPGAASTALLPRKPSGQAGPPAPHSPPAPAVTSSCRLCLVCELLQMPDFCHFHSSSGPILPGSPGAPKRCFPQAHIYEPSFLWKKTDEERRLVPDHTE